jgi:adenylate cyclase
VMNCVVLFDYGNLLMPLGTPLLAIVAAFASASSTRLISEARERARITRRFATYVDPDLVNYVLEVRDESVFDGQRRDTTVVFTDLEGFTKLSNLLGEDIVPLLNDFMGRAVAVIKQHRGLVNKFLGDGILFFFNAPKPNATYVSDAIDAILDLQVMMVGFNEDLAKQNLAKLKLRAGVTTGRVIAGDAGTKDRADYTVIGDLVNLASRLESANKYFGTSNLITEATVKGAGDGFLFRPIGVIRVVGMETGVMTYETLAWTKDATGQQKEIASLSQELHEAFQSGDPRKCLEAVVKLEAVEGPSKITRAYRDLCEPHVAGTKSGAMPREIVLAEK